MNSKDQPKQTIEAIAKELYQDNIVMDIDIDNDLQNAFVYGYNQAQKEIDMLRLDLELSNIDLEKTKKLLKNCENALHQRDEKIEELRREMFTNMNQYAYYFEKCYAERPMKTPLNPSEWFEQQLITKHNGR